MPDKIVNGQSGTPVPTNLTDSEIVKALECCCGGLTSDWCDKCPMNVTKECDKDLLALEKLALDLINRLQEENENYSKNNRQMTSDILKLYKELEQLKAEYERLKDHIQEGIELAKELPEMITLVKTEAYKEFAERLKGAKQYSIERHENIVPVAVIDWILKELVGE